jgi:hypothetical protein
MTLNRAAFKRLLGPIEKILRENEKQYTNERVKNDKEESDEIDINDD